MMKFTQQQLDHADIEDLKRLCKYLGIHPSTDWKRGSLIRWLIYEGYCQDRWDGGIWG